MSTSPTDEMLMAAYIGGEPSAFSELFRRYSPRLRRLMYRDMGSSEEVHDLVQQTFLQLHRARNDFRLDGKLRPWLFTIALNLKRQHFRRVGRRPQSSLDTDEGVLEPVALGPTPESRMVDDQLHSALDLLPEAQREVIVLHWFEGLTFREVALAVGASQPAVKVRAHRGYTKLREVLGMEGNR